MTKPHLDPGESAELTANGEKQFLAEYQPTVARSPRKPDFQRTAKIMRSAYDQGGSRLMSIWLEDIQAVEEALAKLAPPPPAAPVAPYCWVLPGEDVASPEGWLEARISEWGEFTRPLYAAPQPDPQPVGGINSIQFIALLEVMGECSEHVPAELKARVKNLLDYHSEHDTASLLLSVQPAPWTCSARKQGTPGGIAPADCDWPGCGCDPVANKVLEAIDEAGFEITTKRPARGMREGLEAAIRAAKLALFVIYKQGVMPNSNWEGGFNGDLAKAEAALAASPQPSEMQPSQPEPFYGATCPTYPSCTGGCGLGCRHEIETPTSTELIKADLMARAETAVWFKEHPHVSEASVDAIRAAGWSVAVHNDYRLNGEFHTFWLFTKDGRAIKGEGKSDTEALAKIAEVIGGLGAGVKLP